MKTIGLIGGMSWESTSLYYQIINEYIQNKKGGLYSAKCILYSVNFEEIRTILGVPMNCHAYKNGDDLSENLYRSCCKQPLRFGHSRSAFFEDRDVVSKVQQAIPVGIYHGIENVHFIEDEKVCPPPTFEYVNTHLVQGINGCRVPVLGVDCIK